MNPFGPRDGAASDKLLLLSPDEKRAALQPAAVDEAVVTAGGASYPRADLVSYSLPDGGRLWLVSANAPAQIEAERIHALQRDAALRAVFSPTGSDSAGGLAAWFPYIVAAMAVLGLIFKR